ncbi:hypothetical protein, partial [Klebsiella pneumoniae]|uniref:hypothetical protein n=1 Tax=Klebsiella pneumoniae TaxID=573 RepID=UPI001AED0C7F
SWELMDGSAAGGRRKAAFFERNTRLTCFSRACRALAMARWELIKISLKTIDCNIGTNLPSLA